MIGLFFPSLKIRASTSQSSSSFAGGSVDGGGEIRNMQGRALCSTPVLYVKSIPQFYIGLVNQQADILTLVVNKIRDILQQKILVFTTVATCFHFHPNNCLLQVREDERVSWFKKSDRQEGICTVLRPPEVIVNSLSCYRYPGGHRNIICALVNYLPRLAHTFNFLKR